MFVSSSDFVEQFGTRTNTAMTFYGQEKVDYNAKLCVMNMAVHGLNAKIISGDEANSFFHDHFNLDGSCDYVMANPPFNVDKVNAESTQNAGRLPFGLPGVNKNKEVSNANYLWISYFYSYLNETGRAGFVMAASATDSANKDRLIRQQLVETGHVDVMMSVGNNFFYTKSLPCTLWFFDKGKPEERKDKVLFIDARYYYTMVDRTLNEWSEWQMKNLNAIVWLYRGEEEKYEELIMDYRFQIISDCYELDTDLETLSALLSGYGEDHAQSRQDIAKTIEHVDHIDQLLPLDEMLEQHIAMLNASLAAFVAHGDSLDKAEAKELAKAKDKTATTWARFKKKAAAQVEGVVKQIENVRMVIREAKWLTDRFGEGGYADIPGLCKLANRADIEGKNWSLTPGAYVGVEAPEDDGVDFEERMAEIHRELKNLSREAQELMEVVLANYEEMKK